MRLLLATKLFVPQPHATNVARPRLLAKLNAGLTSRLLLLTAPAGFGKTTLVTEWIHALRTASNETERGPGGARPTYAVGWLSLGAEDNVPQRFFAYLIAALQGIDPTIGRDTAPMVTSPQLPPSDQLMTLLINDMTQVNQPFVLVLDDYHLLTDQAIHDAVSFLIEKMPPAMTLAITTRVDPPLPLARWRARRMLTEIRAQELRFTEKEAASFLVDRQGLRLTPDDVVALEKRTEGWIAGLQLAALSLQGRSDTTAFIQNFTGSHAYIIDYLVEEVLQQRSAELENFLLMTSILDRFCAPLCQAVTGHANAQTLLEQIARANLFLFPLDQERRWYRYHQLFADVLRARFNGTDRSVVITCHRRASQWYSEQGFAEEAVHHAFAMEDLAYAATLCAAASEALIRRGQQRVVAGWLEQLPPAAILAHSPLALAHSFLLISRHHLDEAERWLAQVETQFTNEPPAARYWGELHYQQALLASRRYDFDRVLTVGEPALAQLDPTDWELRGKLVLILGLAYYYQPDLPAALRAFADATGYSLKADDLHTALYGMSNQASILLQLGRLHQARTVYAQGLQLVADRQLGQLPAAQMLHADLMNLLYELDERELLVHHAEQVAAAGANTLNPVRRLNNALALALARAAQGDLPLAIAEIEQVLAEFRSHDLPVENGSLIVRHYMAFLLAVGDLAKAVAWAEQVALDTTAALNLARENEYLALAQVWTADGRYEQALALLARLFANAEREGRSGVLVEIGALQAAGLLAAGQTEAARQQAHHLLRRGLTEGYIRSLVAAGEPLRQLLLLLRTEWSVHRHGTAATPSADRGALLEYIDRLLMAFPPTTAASHAGKGVTGKEHPLLSLVTPSTLFTHTAPTPLIEPLSEREREVLRLVADGLSNSQIAERLIVTVGTVKRHLNNIFGKLGVGSRTQAIARARELALL